MGAGVFPHDCAMSVSAPGLTKAATVTLGAGVASFNFGSSLTADFVQIVGLTGLTALHLPTLDVKQLLIRANLGPTSISGSGRVTQSLRVESNSNLSTAAIQAWIQGLALPGVTPSVLGNKLP